MKEIQLIEKTSKQWKALKLVGFLICFLGGPFSCAVSGSIGVGFVVYAVGLSVVFYGYIGAWWNHG
jgi:hypothetical protein